MENSTKTNDSIISRRKFIGSTMATAAFAIVPRHVLGGSGYISPSDKLNIACIGVGGKGRSDVQAVSSENLVAFCDVDDERAAETYKKFPDVKRYRDFRVMLEKEKNIDAVVVSTPDHTHAVISMMAIKMGKHVFCQKPLTHTVYEARRLAQAAREYKVATQMGNQHQAEEEPRRLAEMIRDGAIGAVREVHIWTNRPVWPQGLDRPADTPPVPDTLDWNVWLGPAPARPYHPAYVPFDWRGWLDFGTGALGDMGCHKFDPIMRALKLGYPTSVEASHSNFIKKMTWDEVTNTETYPRASIVRFEFPARDELPPVTITWYDGGLKPFRPAELERGRKLARKGNLIIGDKGKILDGRLIPETTMQAYTLPPKTLPRSPGHYKEWIQACKGGEPAGSNFDFASLVTETVLLGNIALRMGEKLEWDGKNIMITNHPDANQYLHREYRKGWSL